MFVKVKRGLAESTYECERVHFRQGIEDEGNVLGTVRIDLEPVNISLEEDKNNVIIYVMNNDGKTLDSYRWH